MAVDQRVWLITGASSGFGRAIAEAALAAGEVVVAAARRPEAMADLLESAPDRITALKLDVTDADRIEAAVAEVLDRHGRVDVLVNNAGVTWSRSLASTPPDDVVGVLEVNLVAAMLLTRAVLPGMLERRHGAVITIGSLSGRVAMEPLYSASKYGLRGFSLALRRQLDGTGVSASLVSPGKVRTAMTSHVDANLPEPELVAEVVADLVRHPRREVVVPGKHYAIAWLEQALPRLADFAYRRRHWSPVIEEEGATWRS
jgi:NADP-dependent 3-hydroxy acid dehydrogenase YdfG